MADIELIKQVKNKNKQAFRSLFNSHRDKVARTAYLIQDYAVISDNSKGGNLNECR